jgi:hypothetical protein
MYVNVVTDRKAAKHVLDKAGLRYCPGKTCMQVPRTSPGICDETKRALLDLLMQAMSIPDGR